MAPSNPVGVVSTAESAVHPGHFSVTSVQPHEISISTIAIYSQLQLKIASRPSVERRFTFIPVPMTQARCIGHRGCDEAVGTVRQWDEDARLEEGYLSCHTNNLT